MAESMENCFHSNLNDLTDNSLEVDVSGNKKSVCIKVRFSDIDPWESFDTGDYRNIDHFWKDMMSWFEDNAHNFKTWYSIVSAKRKYFEALLRRYLVNPDDNGDPVERFEDDEEQESEIFTSDKFVKEMRRLK